MLQDCAHCLTGLRVVESLSPSQLLLEFFAARSQWLQSLDRVPASFPSLSDLHQRVPAAATAILRALWVLRQTCEHIATLFMSSSTASQSATSTPTTAAAAATGHRTSTAAVTPVPASVAHVRERDLVWRGGSGGDDSAVRAAAVQWLDGFAQQMLVLAAGALLLQRCLWRFADDRAVFALCVSLWRRRVGGSAECRVACRV